jgi:hypothetical protein
MSHAVLRTIPGLFEMLRSTPLVSLALQGAKLALISADSSPDTFSVILFVHVCFCILVFELQSNIGILFPGTFVCRHIHTHWLFWYITHNDSICTFVEDNMKTGHTERIFGPDLIGPSSGPAKRVFAVPDEGPSLPCLMKDQVWSENSLSVYDLFSYCLIVCVIF